MMKLLSLLVVAVALAAGPSLPAETPPAPKGPQGNFPQGMKMPEPDRKTLIEHHQKMAEAHKKMADCLKANKAIRECQEEMRRSMPPPPMPMHMPMHMPGQGNMPGAGNAPGSQPPKKP